VRAGITVALVATLVPLGARSALNADAAGAVHRVDDDGVVGPNGGCNGVGRATFTDIQAAVDAAEPRNHDRPGDTIVVCPGNYGRVRIGNFDEFVFKDGLTLRGARAGVDARSRQPLGSPSESTVQGLFVQATAVTIDGFRVNGGALDVHWESHQVSVLNNLVTNGPSQAGLDLGGTGALARHNLLVDNPGVGIRAGLLLEHSTIDENTVIGSQAASVLVEGGLRPDALRDIVISGNTLDSVVITVGERYRITGNTLVTPSSGGIYLAGTRDTTIDRNRLTGGAGLVLAGGTNNTTITHNQITHGYLSAITLQDVELGPNTDVVAQSNVLNHNAHWGVRIFDGGINNVITYNQIARNSRGGFRNEDVDTPVNGTHNWWGSASGPSVWSIGSGQSVSANVDFFPWATDSRRTSFAACTRIVTPHNAPLGGTAGNDILCGNDRANTIRAGAGSDLIVGSGGADVLHGQIGDDWIVGDRFGTTGDDFIDGGPGNDIAQGREGIDTVTSVETVADF
jgi:Right handed beta helix region/RTX calcium-binding nonapeptide repeat (4 copies)